MNDLKYGIKIMVLILYVCGFFTQILSAQPIEITLSDSLKVSLIEHKTENAQGYYYLPLNFRIAERNGEEEFSFLAWRENDQGEIKGAILHALLTWGLSPKQNEEVEKQLRGIDSTAVLLGAIPVEGEEPAFEIKTDTELGVILKRSLRSSGGVPVFPGDKIALSFMLSATDAQRFIELSGKNKDIFNKSLFALNLRPVEWATSYSQQLITLRFQEIMIIKRIKK